MKEKYLPLKMIEHAQRRDGADGIIAMLYHKGLLKERISDEEYLDFLFGTDFLDPDYRGPCEPINKFVRENRRLHNTLRNELKAKTVKQAVTECMDIFGISSVIMNWAKWKKVYKIDPEFLNELLRTENITVPKGSLSRIPFPTIYVDLSNAEALLPIAGAFVRIVDSPEGENVVIYMITKDCTTFSYYSELSYGKDGLASLPADLVPANDFVAVDMGGIAGTNMERRTLENDRRTDIICAVMQVLLFLVSEAPDITENEATKKTYRPSQSIRNRYSEIQMWDVGIRYGKAIKAAKAEAIKETEVARSEAGTKSRQSPVRKRPRPHVRAAHWQRYHVGQGRKEIRINWIPPVIVLGNKAIPVTIQKIKKEK